MRAVKLFLYGLLAAFMSFISRDKEEEKDEEPASSSIDVEHSGLYMEAQGDPDIIKEFRRQAGVV